MTKVFFCHASRDKALVRHIVGELERYGIDVWIDEREIRVGDSLRQTIEKGLLDSEYVLVALSKVAIERPWVIEELSAALAIEKERGAKVILPVLLEDCEIPLFLRDKKYGYIRNSQLVNNL